MDNNPSQATTISFKISINFNLMKKIDLKSLDKFTTTIFNASLDLFSVKKPIYTETFFEIITITVLSCKFKSCNIIKRCGFTKNIIKAKIKNCIFKVLYRDLKV